MNVLVIGPSAENSKGGMSTVISEMKGDKELCDEFNMDFYESYIDGNKLKVLLFSIYSYLRFLVTKKAKKYDIYHIHAASYGSTFRKNLYIRSIKRNGKKIIFHIHGAEYLKFFDGLSRRKQEYLISMLKSVDVVVALSNDWKKKFEAKFGIANCVAIENGINVQSLKPAISNVENTCHTMVSLGRLGERKGTYDLINAVCSVKEDIDDLKVYLAGDGEIEEAKKLIQKNGLSKNIEVIGWINFEQKVEVLKKSSILLLPSYNEGLPMAILEGMACGKAIISTNVGAIPEVVKETNGILIAPGDIQELENAILSLCQDNKRLKEIKQYNIEKVKNEYSMATMHNKIRKSYKDICK